MFWRSGLRKTTKLIRKLKHLGSNIIRSVVSRKDLIIPKTSGDFLGMEKGEILITPCYPKIPIGIRRRIRPIEKIRNSNGSNSGRAEVIILTDPKHDSSIDEGECWKRALAEIGYEAEFSVGKIIWNKLKESRALILTHRYVEDNNINLLKEYLTMGSKALIINSESAYKKIVKNLIGPQDFKRNKKIFATDSRGKESIVLLEYMGSNVLYCGYSLGSNSLRYYSWFHFRPTTYRILQNLYRLVIPQNNILIEKHPFPNIVKSVILLTADVHGFTGERGEKDPTGESPNESLEKSFGLNINKHGDELDYALELAELSNSFGIAITFFLYGVVSEYFKQGTLHKKDELKKLICDEKNEIGSHTYYGSYWHMRRYYASYTKLSLEQQIKDLVKARKSFSEFGVSVQGFRAHGYGTNKYTYIALDQAGYLYGSNKLVEPNFPRIDGTIRRVNLPFEGSWKKDPKTGWFEAEVGALEMPLIISDDADYFLAGIEPKIYFDDLEKCIDQAVRLKQAFIFQMHPSCQKRFSEFNAGQYKLTTSIFEKIKQSIDKRELISMTCVEYVKYFAAYKQISLKKEIIEDRVKITIVNSSDYNFNNYELSIFLSNVKDMKELDLKGEISRKRLTNEGLYLSFKVASNSSLSFIVKLKDEE